VIQSLAENTLLPHSPFPNESSLAAAPLCRAGRIAGCLLIASADPFYFETAGIEPALIQAYADLISSGLDYEDFYDPRQIQLRIMPSYEEQQQYLASFQRRVAVVLRKAAEREEVMMTKAQAEKEARQEIEQLLIAAAARITTPTDI
jgi:hypothetical protein